MTWPMHDAGPTTPDPGPDEPTIAQPWPAEPWRDEPGPGEPDGPPRGRHAAPDPLGAVAVGGEIGGQVEHRDACQQVARRCRIAKRGRAIQDADELFGGEVVVVGVGTGVARAMM